MLSSLILLVALSPVVLKGLMRSGKLAAAGPFKGDGRLSEILIFQSATPEEARALVEHHPAVRSGRLAFEIHPWWAAKGTLP